MLTLILILLILFISIVAGFYYLKRQLDILRKKILYIEDDVNSLILSDKFNHGTKSYFSHKIDLRAYLKWALSKYEQDPDPKDSEVPKSPYQEQKCHQDSKHPAPIVQQSSAPSQHQAD